MSTRLRGFILVLALAAVVGVLSGAAGLVYSHEPQPDEVRLQVDRRPAEREGTLLRGSIVSVEGSTLLVRTEDGVHEVALGDAVAVEEITPLDPADLLPGTTVLLGGDATASDLVVTGVVAIEEVTP